MCRWSLYQAGGWHCRGEEGWVGRSCRGVLVGFVSEKVLCIFTGRIALGPQPGCMQMRSACGLALGG